MFSIELCHLAMSRLAKNNYTFASGRKAEKSFQYCLCRVINDLGNEEKEKGRSGFVAYMEVNYPPNLLENRQQLEIDIIVDRRPN
jgi:hypothetical protein